MMKGAIETWNHRPDGITLVLFVNVTIMPIEPDGSIADSSQVVTVDHLWRRTSTESFERSKRVYGINRLDSKLMTGEVQSYMRTDGSSDFALFDAPIVRWSYLLTTVVPALVKAKQWNDVIGAFSGFKVNDYSSVRTTELEEQMRAFIALAHRELARTERKRRQAQYQKTQFPANSAKRESPRGFG